MHNCCALCTRLNANVPSKELWQPFYSAPATLQDLLSELDRVKVLFSVISAGQSEC